MNLIEVWHYHRPVLAKLYLDTLNAGIVTSTTIFAPRRSGKTAFLLKDLKPAAEQAGYIVVYADLWQTKLSPGIAIVRALEQAVEPKTALDSIIGVFNAPVKKLKAKTEIAGAKIEGEIELGDESSSVQPIIALQIDALIEKLCNKKPVLLLIDEAQELAKKREHEAVATALRTAITKNQSKLRVVFTGSSRTQLAHVFSNSNSPLYSTGSVITEFPHLGTEFVEYIRDRFYASTKRVLPMKDALEAFIAFKYQPEPFLIGIVALTLNPELKFNDAMQVVAEKMAHSDNHEGVWSSFDETQKALVRMLADDPLLKPFSKSVIVKLRNIIGVDALDTTHIQRAMQKLSKMIVKTQRDTYEFENESFAQWVRKLAD